MTSILSGQTTYESDRVLGQYLLFHYGSPLETTPFSFAPREATGFPVRCLDLLDRSTLSASVSALDIGCAVGGSTFELSTFCDRVIGVDLSENFVKTAQTLQSQHKIDYQVVEEGLHVNNLRVVLPASCRPDRVRFFVGDALALDASWFPADVVVALNLLCRVPDPEKLLRRFSEYVAPGGQLLLATPFTWLAEFTDRDKWLGGTERRSIEVVEDMLNESFTLERTEDVPYFIREHVRLYQWGVAKVTRWRRR